MRLLKYYYWGKAYKESNFKMRKQEMDSFREVTMIRVVTQTLLIAGQALVVIVTYIVFVETGN